MESINLEILIQLGLTTNEAKTYFSLIKLGNASIKTIARAEKIDRANLYRTMLALQENGLIQVILGEPNIYKAVPFDDGIRQLLGKKTREFNDLKRRSLVTIEKVKGTQMNENTIRLEDEGLFEIVPDLSYGDGKVSIFSKAIAKSKQSIDTVIKASDYMKITSYNESQKIEGSFEARSKKGCRIRFLLYNDKKDELIEYIRKRKFLQNKGAIEIRIVTKPLDAAFAIIDRKDVFFHTKPLLSDWLGSTCLRSKNACLVGTIQSFFDGLWSSAELI